MKEFICAYNEAITWAHLTGRRHNVYHGGRDLYCVCDAQNTLKNAIKLSDGWKLMDSVTPADVPLTLQGDPILA